MKLISAVVANPPREVTTKYGDRVVLDCTTNDGQSATIWRGAGDQEALGRYPGERVLLSLDSKGKFSLIETASTGLNEAPVQQSKSAHKADEIREYTQKLAKLYLHCFRTVDSELGDSGLSIESLKDISTCLFVQTTRKFEL